MSSKLDVPPGTAAASSKIEPDARKTTVSRKTVSPVFKRLRRDESETGDGAVAPAIYEEVIAQIKALLREGQYNPGDKLPSERELSERLGVNRNAVREAIRALTLLGVIQTRPQSGSHLSTQLEGMLRLPFEFLMLMLRPSYQEIQELRGLIEVYAAGRAAERRTDTDIRNIEAALQELYATNHQLNYGGGPNRRFHRAVAAATHNRLLEYLLFCLLEARSTYIRSLSPTGTGRREQNHNHERLLLAIRQGDAAAARLAMQDDMGTAAQVGEIINSPSPPS